LAELFPELEEAIRAAGAGSVLDDLNPGLSEDQIRTEFARINLRPPDEVVTWFQWHNGGSGSVAFTPFFALLPLQRAIENYQKQELGTEPWQYRPGWLAYAGTGLPSLVDCNGNPADPAPVRFHDTWDGGFVSESPESQPQPSMCVPVTWWIEALHNGNYRWLPDRNLWTGEHHGPYPIERTGLS
jgi:hypothetical protein